MSLPLRKLRPREAHQFACHLWTSIWLQARSVKPVLLPGLALWGGDGAKGAGSLEGVPEKRAPSENTSGLSSGSAKRLGEPAFGGGLWWNCLGIAGPACLPQPRSSARLPARLAPIKTTLCSRVPGVMPGFQSTQLSLTFSPSRFSTGSTSDIDPPHTPSLWLISLSSCVCGSHRRLPFPAVSHTHLLDLCVLLSSRDPSTPCRGVQVWTGGGGNPAPGREAASVAQSLSRHGGIRVVERGREGERGCEGRIGGTWQWFDAGVGVRVGQEKAERRGTEGTPPDLYVGKTASPEFIAASMGF